MAVRFSLSELSAAAGQTRAREMKQTLGVGRGRRLWWGGEKIGSSNWPIGHGSDWVKDGGLD